MHPYFLPLAGDRTILCDFCCLSPFAVGIGLRPQRLVSSRLRVAQNSVVSIREYIPEEILDSLFMHQLHSGYFFIHAQLPSKSSLKTATKIYLLLKNNKRSRVLRQRKYEFEHGFINQRSNSNILTYQNPLFTSVQESLSRQFRSEILVFQVSPKRRKFHFTSNTSSHFFYS